MMFYGDRRARKIKRLEKELIEKFDLTGKEAESVTVGLDEIDLDGVMTHRGVVYDERDRSKSIFAYENGEWEYITTKDY